ncbi:molecular chaperone [Metasolibacillus meyeri]|uniref:Molecular chaperone n=1 Tax=Metasolibacillus meyeri TaxID=1071052 RepID=A0AAW9NMH6_9BACL|nr:molecular chaperone [Metasolibacillus meyeri]MEC1180049.1 molecular chaperone [Metasolibacillus meyeri]
MKANYSYKLHTNRRYTERYTVTYTRAELMEMTTFQLRNICYKEKIVKGLVNTLTRDQLVQMILRYRGAEEHLLIQDEVDGGFKRVEAAMQAYLKTPLADNGNIKVPAKMSIYPELKIDETDQYVVETGGLVEESNVLLVNEQLALCGILNLQKDKQQPNRYYLTTEAAMNIQNTKNKNYSFIFLRKQDSDYLYKAYYQEASLPPTNLHYYKVPVLDLEMKELETTNAILAIDFGTTNTTAGAYLAHDYVTSPCSQDLLNNRIQLNQINFVTFPDTMHQERTAVVSTIISVADCSDVKHIQYHFGYDALQVMKKNNYTTLATKFQGMKRWINHYHKTEEIMDVNGNTAVVPRSQMLRQFLLYIVQTAEHQFKCRFQHLHISSPVKLKTQFLDMFQTILPDYHIETTNALDEGMAVLYNTIANQIENNSFLDGKNYKALVIDCGGGTTDLSSCQFRIIDGRISYKIDIHTTYENGDTNFGGNNITYRIFQFMKIVFANYYNRSKEAYDIDALIDIPGKDIYRYVDEFGVEAVYAHFEQAFVEAERIIPTRFKEYENRTRDEYLRVRNNYYFLWEMAEEMKKEFFRKTGILRSRFHSTIDAEQDSDLNVTAVDRWCLSIKENEQFQDIYDYPNVYFNIKEINHLIKADIYDIVRKFLEDFYETGVLSEYSIIKLTGQSCKIDAFREALKEFVPGRSIEFRQKAESIGNVPELKLACLRGALRYLNAQKIGMIETNVTNDAPVVPYAVSALTHNKQEKLLISSLERLNQIHGTISRPWGVVEVEFFLHNHEDKSSYKYVYTNHMEDFMPVLYEQIATYYGEHIPQSETDSIVNGEVKFFVFASQDHWGFHVVPVARQNEQLLLGKKHFFAFETDLSELDFFDGLK